jgi:hypothetical protein
MEDQNYRVRISVYNEDTNEEVAHADTFVNASGSFEEAEMELGSLERFFKKKIWHSTENVSDVTE